MRMKKGQSNLSFFFSRKQQQQQLGHSYYQNPYFPTSNWSPKNEKKKKKSLLLLVLLLLAKSLNCQFGHNHDITNSHVILISIRASFQMIFLSQYIIFSKPFFLIGRGEKIVEKKKKKSQILCLSFGRVIGG